jgi:hypothetical protein
MRTKVCAQGILQNLYNPKKYAMHLPTMKFDCEDVIEKYNDDLVDALTLGEDMDEFCTEQDVCTRTHRDEL